MDINKKQLIRDMDRLSRYYWVEGFGFGAVAGSVFTGVIIIFIHFYY